VNGITAVVLRRANGSLQRREGKRASRNESSSPQHGGSSKGHSLLYRTQYFSLGTAGFAAPMDNAAR